MQSKNKITICKVKLSHERERYLLQFILKLQSRVGMCAVKNPGHEDKLSTLSSSTTWISVVCVLDYGEYEEECKYNPYFWEIYCQHAGMSQK